MGTKSKSLCLLAIILLQSLCLAVATKLPAKYRKSFEDSSRFREAHSTTNLPASVVALCADGKGMLAEPGQKWEATDVITNAKLPRNRLIWAATADPYYVVHYERGGRGHSFLILIVVFRKESANPHLPRRCGLGR